jgi:hypothetical protein
MAGWRRKLVVAVAGVSCGLAASVSFADAPRSAAVGDGEGAVLPARTSTDAIACDGEAPERATPHAYRREVERALRSRRDRWGEEQLSQAGGPTYERVEPYLVPAWWAVGQVGDGTRAKVRRLTRSGAYYLPLGQPAGPPERRGVALHVADGSEIISNRVGRRGMTISVGATGTEPFGRCVGRIEGPDLGEGYLPILQVGYRDPRGVRYRQESLATFIPGTERLASFVRIGVTRAELGTASTRIRFDICDCPLTREGDRLVSGPETHLYFSPGANLSEGVLTYDLDLSDGAEAFVYVVRPIVPQALPRLAAGEEAHDTARLATREYWRRRLTGAATFSVPEPRVMNAQRNLLIQNLLMGPRYSIGNAYEQFFQPESADALETIARYGFTRTYRGWLRYLLHRSKGRNRRNWEIGEKLLRAADYWWLTRDGAFVDETIPTHAAFAADLADQRRDDAHGLLEKQQYSSDISTKVHGLHQLARAAYGLKAIVAVWRRTGHTRLARTHGPVARDLDRALRRAVAAAAVELRDGSLFTPVALGDEARPYGALTHSRQGGYWNLVAPFAFASKLYEPRGEQASRTIAYLRRHGSRLLGTVRARRGGINDVYGLEQAKFLADNGHADDLVLGLYGNLAHARARGTFIAGEATNIGPLAQRWPSLYGACTTRPRCSRAGTASSWADHDRFRALYNPPNGANNATFLWILRAMLVHELSGDAHVPNGLQLAFATPRGWLEDGKRIAVQGAPTPFGRVSYEIRSRLRHGLVTAVVHTPRRDDPHPLILFLRVPDGARLASVTVNGVAHGRFDPRRQLIDLTDLGGTIRVVARYVVSNP